MDVQSILLTDGASAMSNKTTIDLASIPGLALLQIYAGNSAAQVGLSIALVLCLGVLLYFSLLFRAKARAIQQLRKEVDVLEQRLQVGGHTDDDHTPMQLDYERINQSVQHKLNQTDLTILKTLVNDPFIPNMKLSDLASLSEEGTSSSLRKMYILFHVNKRNNKKLLLVKKVMQIGTGREDVTLNFPKDED